MESVKSQRMGAITDVEEESANEKSEVVNKIQRVQDRSITVSLSNDTTCGFWILKGKYLQIFANKRSFVFLNGVIGCLVTGSYSYFSGTISTIEKRFKIPSRNTGIISVGNDISSLFLSTVLSYYAGKGHRPRWLAFSLLTIVAFCWLNALPHLIYGPGEAALGLTTNYHEAADDNSTEIGYGVPKGGSLCRLERIRDTECELEEGNFAPQVILFVAQLISGIGSTMHYNLGISYMDDNIKKSKSPALISVSFFMRMLGPAMGYTLASYCLELYISPTLTPTITNEDPRWLGAWWIGWLVLGSLTAIFALLIAMFPRQLPRIAARNRMLAEKRKLKLSLMDPKEKSDRPVSFEDMIEAFKRLVKNKTLMLNNFATVFYFFGYMPYWIFTPKYIETQYKQSASTSNFVTGTVAMTFSAIGILVSGLVITRYKPRARYLAAWNVLVGISSVMGMITYAFLGCPASESSVTINDPSACTSVCHCDFVQYSPICGEDGNTYISACHAGCKNQQRIEDVETYNQCSCVFDKNISSNFVQPSNSSLDSFNSFNREPADNGKALDGPCPVGCQSEFLIFLVVMCFLKFSGATGLTSNLLVSVRCVEIEDKTVSIGLGMFMVSLMALIPSPIFYGYVLDSTCLVWGKTCSGQGNCWLYDGESLRYLLNYTAAAFVLLGTTLDLGVWYYVKDLEIFNDDDI
ncbi:solute carrier organic anion transporter family member 74D-like [Malaya genurostris]|uniref:solute carrier organic anion transporter family member 74D-like n=1 Tax=Malaya genurostris TaxID=325434 RepID=UPI0026F3FD54|nr:solute carrier organic anion transporter family member 74D-like [Malaya genurostris]XP_058460414.1 solute carrier organic anion transporter family member 74D-like [Malaya genurostris]XP_058460415.1 solute carrier organic anion transporter family member 74D-like [Malaya genurostris]XP_058460416.1 solute carrier organic anion transporter family member 74D-like [Malaya genurostris]